jgi:hypothetical protein
MINIFDNTFEKYENTERKTQIRNGLVQRRELIYKYMDNPEVKPERQVERKGNTFKR